MRNLGRRFDRKTCIVTGSGGSIGRALALRLAAEGANVIGCDIAAAEAEETVRLVTAAGGSIASLQPIDLTVQADCVSVISYAMDTFGAVDVLVNNGGKAYFGWISEISDETWYKTINEELHLVFLLTRAAWPQLVESRGAIVNVASVSAWVGYEMLPGLAHSAAKGAVLSLTRHLAMEGREPGIRCNSVSPGTIETNQTSFILDDPVWSRKQLGRAMMNRMGQPEEVASAIAFLASSDASYVTGADLRIDGGQMAW